MGLFQFFGNYNKPGPGVSKDEAPKAAPIRFFEIYFRKFSKLVQLNLIFLLPTIAAIVMMIGLYFCPTHIILKIPSPDSSVQMDIWNWYILPLPLILLTPFTAGLTIVTRNFAREEHAFVWSDFWESVKNNWKPFLLNGLVFYLVYFILSFSIIYYYVNASSNSFYYIPFWVCIVIAVLFLFAQYYLPVMFVTFDLKFGQFYKNALIFILAGFGRNFLVTLILGVLLFLILAVIPVMPLTVMLFLLFFLFIVFSFVSYLINFAVYPVINQYMIQPYQQAKEKERHAAGKEEAPKDPLEEKFPGIFSSGQEEESDEGSDGDYVYTNGKLVRKSDLTSQKEEKKDK